MPICFVTSFQSVAEVSVTIDIKKPEHHLATVSLVIPIEDQAQVSLALPAWRTGRYEILNLADSIRQFVATNESGEPFTWQKTDKSTWKINDVSGQFLHVSYEVYANELGYRTRHIDESHAFLDASGVVMYNEFTRGQQHTIKLNVPEKWRSASGLRLGREAHQFIATDYDVLIDSPIETGEQEVHNFTVDNRQYELVIWGKGNYDSAKMVADLTVMVQQAGKIWQSYPFSRYVFMVHATSGAGGATEHINSTIIQRPRFSFAERKDYLGFIGTAAHEFVHTWNVKAYRPEGLAPYDYQQENYSSLIWMSEGSTSYLQYQLLTRGEIMTAKEFLEDIAKRITGFERKQGRKVQSVAEASFDTWISGSGDFEHNNGVNIYSEGYLVSWLLDFAIMEQTKLAKSYRDVHNALYANYALPHAFSEQDVKSVLQEITGVDYSAWWQDNVHGLPQPDFSALLAKAGLEMSYGNDKQEAWTGISVKTNDGLAQVKAVEKDSPAWQAGLTTDDLIVAVDGLRLDNADLDKRLKNFKPEQSISFTLFRRDELITKTITLAAKPAKKLVVKAMKQASEQQQAFFTHWTGLAFPNKTTDKDE